MLSEQVFVTAKTLRGDDDVCIYIRNYNRTPKGLLCSGKLLGVKLSLGQWKQLIGNMKNIGEALVDIKKGRDTSYMEQLGSDTYVRVNTGFVGVTIRHWRRNKNNLIPTKRAVSLDPLQWNLLTTCLNITVINIIMKTRGLTCSFCLPNLINDDS
jgi:hypothetical protein